MHPDIEKYNDSQIVCDREICSLLVMEIDRAVPEAESKIWHGHPVWFIDGNPIVGYSKQKNCVSLLFWSGQSFETPGLEKMGKFKAAQAKYTAVEQIDREIFSKWLAESLEIQWDYKNIVRRKGKLERLK